MNRPVDWSPLATADPVPGDPVEVARLGRRYRDTADEITRQAANLRKLSEAANSSWDSDAGREFAEHSEELATKLTEVHDRYAAAADALREWSGPLEDAQRTADSALADAKSADERLRSEALQPLLPLVSPLADPTPEEQEATRRRMRAHTDATTALDAARRRLGQAVDEYHAAASRAAGRLRDVVKHDPVHDSFWDRTVVFLKKACKVLGWVVTGLLITALLLSLCVPGLNMAALGLVIAYLEGTAFALTGLLATMHGVLAATDNASWLDVGIDIVALATLGYGRGALTAMKAVDTGATTVAANTAAARASAKELASHRIAYKALNFFDRIPGARNVLGTARRIEALDASVAAAGEAARTSVQSIKASTTLVSRLQSGGYEAAKHLDHVNRLAARVPGEAGVTEAVSQATHLSHVHAGNVYLGTTVDGVNHAVELGTHWKHQAEPYFTAPVIRRRAAGVEE